MTTSNETLIQQGIAAARSGQREQARTILMSVIEGDERNYQAWLWLSGVVDDPAEQRICLENVLDVDPGNAQALKGMAWLNAHFPVSAPEPTPALEATDQSAPPMPPAVVPPAVAETVAPTKEPISIPVGPLPFEENPCPYCGAATMLSQQRCPHCKQSLMVRVAGGKGLRSVLGLGELQRIALTVEDVEHVLHYNRGVAYRKQGMWYMAVREWEAAVKKRPADGDYRRALGLAYAQIKQFGRGIRELREAGRLRPDDQVIRDDLDLVEKLALETT